MNEKNKQNGNTPFYFIIAIFILSIVIFIYIRNFPGQSMSLNFNQNTLQKKELPENDSHKFLNQINDLEAKLLSCTLELEKSLKGNDKIAVLKIENYRKIFANILSLNLAFHNQIDYEESLNNIISVTKQPELQNPNLMSQFSILDDYNKKYVKPNSPHERVSIGSGWSKKFLDRWISIEKIDHDYKNKPIRQEEATSALNEVNKYITSEEFLNKFIGK